MRAILGREFSQTFPARAMRRERLKADVFLVLFTSNGLRLKHELPRLDRIK